MRLSESFTIDNFRIELTKESGRETQIEVSKRSPVDDDDSTVFRGDITGFRKFCAMHETFLHHANKFNDLEVPRI